MFLFSLILCVMGVVLSIYIELELEKLKLLIYVYFFLLGYGFWFVVICMFYLLRGMVGLSVLNLVLGKMKL